MYNTTVHAVLQSHLSSMQNLAKLHVQMSSSRECAKLHVQMSSSTELSKTFGHAISHILRYGIALVLYSRTLSYNNLPVRPSS